jgi:DNA-binding transcriptional MerR regulator
MAESRPESLPSKLYFRIGEVADLVGVEPHVLRYWEREFRTIRPTKSAKGQRVYSRRDVENLMRVRELLYREGFTIAGAKKKLLHPEAAETTEPVPVNAAVDNTARTRDQLLAMRGEIEAFLADLGSQGR